MNLINSAAPLPLERSPWGRRGGLLLALLALLVGVYGSTLVSMVEIWERSETFSHGFTVFPISVFLIWRQRHAWLALTPRTDWRALPLLLGMGVIWLLARLAGVLVAEQLAFVMMIPLLIWLVTGWQAVRSVLFPLAFMLFAVPMGEFLIIPMMDFTAVFVVEAIRLTGIPIYASGTFFSLPSGDWSVVEGCSGVRYLIASVTLGALYAYLAYRSYTKRVLFILAAFAFPIVGNWLRALMIVLLGHFSNMKLATGVDHIIYGWVFFGLIILLLFWLGSFWSEETAPPGPSAGVARHSRGTLLPCLLVALMAVVWPRLPLYLADKASTAEPAPLDVTRLEELGAPIDPFTNWEPRYINPDQTYRQAYAQPVAPVGVYLAYYGRQRQGQELINSQNVLVEQKHPVWQQLARQSQRLEAAAGGVPYWESRLSSANQDLLVWDWREIEGYAVGSSSIGKALEAFYKIQGRVPRGLATIIYTPIESAPAQARERLRAVASQLISGDLLTDAGLHSTRENGY